METISCPYCGGSHPANAQYCPVTGKVLQHQNDVCQHCGATLPTEVSFCPICGKATDLKATGTMPLWVGQALTRPRVRLAMVVCVIFVVGFLVVFAITSVKPLLVNLIPPVVQIQSSPFVLLTTTPQQPSDFGTSTQEVIQIPIQQVTTILQTETVAHPSDPETFIRSYFNSVWQDRNYNYLWSLSTPSFQANASSGGYQEFTSWWGSVDRVDVLSVTVMSNDGHFASVDVHVTFYLKDGRVLKNRDYPYDLIYDSGRQTWMFDYR